MLEPRTENGRVGIIADDLTSAADGASPFLMWGSKPRIYRGRPEEDDAPVISVDAGSRDLPEHEAAQAVGRVTSDLATRPTLNKTLDSTLRGHARAEIAAAFRASCRDRLVIGPAIPAAGRTTVGGIQLLRGRPVSETAYSADPIHPALTSRVLDLVDPLLGRVVVIPCDMDAQEFLAVARAARVVVLDADQQTTLNRRVADLARVGTSLSVGSPGMARALAARSSTCIAMVTARASARRVLVVVGSANEVSRQQCEALKRGGVPVCRRAADMPDDRSIICLTSPLARNADPKAVLSSLIDEVKVACETRTFDAVIATGGETMAALLERLAIRSFVLTAEFEDGFPVGQTEPGQNRPSLILAMKAGGFGSQATLLTAARQLVSTPTQSGPVAP